jgi:hypothetical protein
MRKILAFLSLLNFPAFLFSQSVRFSDSLDFSVLTVSPGTELYSVFGHTAIRLIDYKQGYDYVFNYGTFDFQTEGFYFKFALGRLDYRLSVESFDDFMQMCQYENRTVVAQQLNLTHDQKQELLWALIENYKPENRYYRYKFFTDNCATRVRDILSKHIRGIHWYGLSQVDSAKTFRQLYRPYLKNMPWTLMGIELLMGPMADHTAGYDVMYLPDKLMQALTLAKRDNESLVAQQTVLYGAVPMIYKTPFFTPLLLIIVLIIVAVAVQFTTTIKRIFDHVLFTVVGLLGLFILVLSLVSAHKELHCNATVLFFFPFLFLWPWIKNETFRLYLLYSALGVIAVALLIVAFLHQHFNITTLLLAVVIIIRLLCNVLEILAKNRKQNFFVNKFFRHEARF